jgi:hypothetical protein
MRPFPQLALPIFNWAIGFGNQTYPFDLTTRAKALVTDDDFKSPPAGKLMTDGTIPHRLPGIDAKPVL